MAWLVPPHSSAAAAAHVTLLLSCLCLVSASQLPKTQGKGRSLIPLTAQEAARCPSASLEALLTSTLTTRLLPALYSVVLLVGLPANALACWVLATNFRRCSSTLFLLNLAVADLLFILLLPFKISYHLLGNHWVFGDSLCRVVVAAFYGNMYGSILFLTCVGLERYVSLVHPFLWKGSSCSRGKAAVCVAIWLLVGLGMSPLLLSPQTRHVSSLNITTCHDVLGEAQHTFFIYYFPSLVGLGFGLPFLLTTVSYSCILLRLLAKGRRYGRVVQALVLVLLVFILCFTPSNVLLFIHYRAEATGCHNSTYIWYTLALALGAFSNCFDPFIYFYVSRDFRSWIQEPGSCCCCCSQGVETSGEKTLEKAALPPGSSQQSQV